MSDRYLKHIPSGVIYIWQTAFAVRDDFVEVADLQGTPMNVIEGDFKVIPNEVVEDKPVKKGKRGISPVADELDDLLAAQQALNADASRGM